MNKFIFDDGAGLSVASGVTMIHGSTTKATRALGEVILAAKAFNLSNVLDLPEVSEDDLHQSHSIKAIVDDVRRGRSSSDSFGDRDQLRGQKERGNVRRSRIANACNRSSDDRLRLH